MKFEIVVLYIYKVPKIPVGLFKVIEVILDWILAVCVASPLVDEVLQNHNANYIQTRWSIQNLYV